MASPYAVEQPMREGWSNGEYLILFEDDEVLPATARYGISARMPGFVVVGLRGWDDFILRHTSGDVVTVPTVPILPEHMQPFPLSPGNDVLEPDPRFNGLIKWYVTPLVFGGDVSSGANMIWVTHDEHAQLVRWWNDKYDEVTGSRRT
jgi:hypothetical protein